MEDYSVYEYDEWYWDSIPVDEIYDTAEELDLMDWDEQLISVFGLHRYYTIWRSKCQQ